MSNNTGIVERYLVLGLEIGEHIPGFVDAYYGPAQLASDVAKRSKRPPVELVHDARSLLASIDAGEALAASGQDEVSASESASRRAWIRAQVLGLYTSARILAGEQIAYADEVQACYGIRPTRVSPQSIEEAHHALEQVVPGSGRLAERLITWREGHAVSPDKLEEALHSLAEDLRARTIERFGLPDGESVDFVLVRNQPWSGFNYFLGNLHSRVAINTDLPVLSTSLAHLVSHEAYPGHHTEHCRKEVGLVRRRRWLEESIFLVGTPQCLLAEGLADLGLEVLFGERPEPLIAEHLLPLGIAYDAETIGIVAKAGEALQGVRANAAFRLHEDKADPQTVVEEVMADGLMNRDRAEKAVQFLLDPTWRSYISCYVEGLPLCRRYVGHDAARFEALITEQLIPADLIAASAP